MNMLNKKHNNGFIITLIFTFSVIIGACTQAKLPDCLKESEKYLSISWGKLDNKTGRKVFYRLTGEAGIYYVERDSVGVEDVSYKTKISSAEFCDIKSKLQELIIKKQTINFPGDEQSFLEYRNPYKDIYFVSMWNDKFTNVGNKEYKEFLEKLNSLLKQK